MTTFLWSQYIDECIKIILKILMHYNAFTIALQYYLKHNQYV